MQLNVHTALVVDNVIVATAPIRDAASVVPSPSDGWSGSGLEGGETHLNPK
jgi:hypothetical protein